MAKKKENEQEGVWRTIGGRKVFIRKGQSLSDAMKESGKFKKASDVKRGAFQDLNAEINYINQREKSGEIEQELIAKNGQYTSSMENWSKKDLNKVTREVGKSREAREEYFARKYRDITITEDTGDKSKLKGKHIEGKEIGLSSKSTKDLKKEYENVLDNYYYMQSDTVGGMSPQIDEYRRRINDIEKEFRNRGIETKTRYGDVKYFQKDTEPKYQPKEIEYTGQDGKTHLMNNYEYPKERDEYHKYLQNKYGTYKEEEIKNSDGRTDYKKLREEFYENKKEYDLYKQAQTNPDSIDPMTEHSTDWEALDKKYKDRYNKEFGRKDEHLTYGEFKKKINDITSSDSYNQKIDKIIEDMNKKKTGNDYLPKESKITTQGTSNRKEVSDNIQAHILSYYDNPVDFMEQMDAIDYLPTRWRAGEEMAKGGNYLIYNGDMQDYLGTLGINPKGKKFSDDRAFQTYTSLVGRESERLYTKMEKLFEQYKKEHKNSNATLDDFRKWFK